MVLVPSGHDERAKAVVAFVEAIGSEPTLSLAFEEATIYARVGTGVRYQVDERSGVGIICCGSPFCGPSNCSDSDLDRMLSIYGSGGVSGVAGAVTGSCALLVVDGAIRLFALITDRVNSTKLFVTEHRGCHWLSTSLQALPVDLVDPAGVASYLINRFQYAGRTIYAGVRCLEGGSIYTWGQSGFARERYWRFDPGVAGVDGSASGENLTHTLGDLLLQAVSRRIPDAGRAYCSLSGGIDSRVVLMAMLKNGGGADRPHVLSYGEVGDDAEIAMRLARRYRLVDHRYGFDGDLHGAIRANAELCEGAVFFYPRLKGFLGFAATLGPDDVVFLGDECFGWQDPTLLDFDDVLRVVGIRPRVCVPSYYDAATVCARAIDEALNEDNRRLEESLRGRGTWHDMKDALYLEERLAYMILTWRQFHAGRFARIANPWLDNDVLDFVRIIPTALRLDKRLFRETAAALFPDIAEIPFARPGGVPHAHLHQRLASHAAAVRELITGRASRLDEILPPDLVLASLLDVQTRLGVDSWVLPQSVREGLVRVSRKLRRVWFPLRPAGTRARRPKLPDMILAPPQMEALLTLRTYLAN